MFCVRNHLLKTARQFSTTVVRHKNKAKPKAQDKIVSKKAGNWLPQDKYTNPIGSLQPLVTAPLMDPPEGLFTATAESMKKSDKLFESTDGKPWLKIKGAIDHTKLEDRNLPEVCFLGRSNVGKSSLVSSLMYHAETARVSGIPGHTKSIQQFIIAKRFTLVDMPGYGYNMPEHFRSSVEEYLQHRKQLHRTFLLIDGKVGIASTDEVALNMLEEIGKPYTIVLTKIDTVPAGRMIETIMQVMEVQKRLPCSFPQLFLLSSHADVGVSFLRAFIAEITVYLQDQIKQMEK